MPRAYETYLRDIVDAARHIEAQMAGVTSEQFSADDSLLRIIGFDLIVIGEACNHIPQDTRERRPDVEWTLIIAMRNRIVHGYWQIDLPTVWQATQKYVPELRIQIESLLDELENEI
ncbi:DUF86 domain-containing protein [Chloroflexota bacterium]